MLLVTCDQLLIASSLYVLVLIFFEGKEDKDSPNQHGIESKIELKKN